MHETAAEAEQARATIRRLSPQGRAGARRLRAARARRARRLATGWLAVAVVVFAGYYALGAVAGPFGTTGLATATAVMLGACAVLAMRALPTPATAPTVAPGELPQLPARVEAWLADQRPALPAPAAALLDGIAARVAALAPHLAGLDADGEPADALRRLAGDELPGLVERYRAIPVPLRAEPGGDGTTPDARLLHALEVVDRELAALTRRIGAVAADGLSTHDRYLTGKYGTGAPEGRR